MRQFLLFLTPSARASCSLSPGGPDLGSPAEQKRSSHERAPQTTLQTYSYDTNEKEGMGGASFSTPLSAGDQGTSIR